MSWKYWGVALVAVIMITICLAGSSYGGVCVADDPKVKVLVQAASSAVVVIDGRPVTLDSAGKGEHAVDVSHELEGPADAIVPFERKLPYAVTLAGGGAHQGDVTLRFGILE